ncbi:MAG: hypothetical protein Q9181_003541, partial [Wetmoreana brouardii]
IAPTLVQMLQGYALSSAAAASDRKAVKMMAWLQSSGTTYFGDPQAQTDNGGTGAACETAGYCTPFNERGNAVAPGGIGLIASVAQLISFGIQTVSTVREVHEQGSIGKYDDLEYATNHLTKLTESLQRSLQQSPRRSNIPPSALTREEKELIELARRCRDSIDKLQQELRQLQSPPHTSVLAATKRVARAVWRKNRIEEINQRLEVYRSTLETSLLYRLSHGFEAQSLRTNQCFASLDGSLQHIVRCLADSQTSLATLTGREAEQTRSHTTTENRRLEQLHVDDRLYDEVTKSLFYPDIFSRQEQVDYLFDGIENSYEWVFQEPGNADVAPLWDDFAAWLKSGQGVYWINGKAGSGKSTLMNYICQHSLRMELLKEWCVDRQLLTPAYFFWSAGSIQQKSVNGLLRSLIYQILTECRELVGCLKFSVATCIFIDGLDEINGPYDSILRLIASLADQENIKICLSSRPLLVFEEAFQKAPGLKLQDLTYDSIRLYADVQLSDIIQKRALYNVQDGSRAKDLVEEIVGRANGVFLWAVIAIRDIRDGLQGIVDLDELATSIKSLPSELESLFMMMLNRIKPAYQHDAARDWMYWHPIELTLCKTYFIHSERDFEEASLNHEKVALSDVVEACRILKVQLLSHTAGLLELTPSGHADDYLERSLEDLRGDSFLDTKLMLRTEINFLHRTARDFLTQNDKAKSFLAQKGYPKAQVHLAIARGTLAQLAQFSGKQRSRAALWDFVAALQHISLTERIVGAAQSNLMRSLVKESYVLRYRRGGQYSYLHDVPILMTDKGGVLIDVVAIAAGTGMTRFVCQQLDISAASQNYIPVLSVPDYCANRIPLATSSLIPRDRPDGSDVGSALPSGLSYRQTLYEFLRQDPPSRATSAHGTGYGCSVQVATSSAPRLWAHDAFAETYLLWSCAPSSHELARILLHEGADPMIQFDIQRFSGYRTYDDSCFWARWLKFLQQARFRYVISKGKSGGIMLNDWELGIGLTPDTVFDTTKALLAHGTDVDFPLRNADSTDIFCYLKRRSLASALLDLVVNATAMFVLEECFNKEPEFREFAFGIQSFYSKPTRKLLKIQPRWTVTYNDSVKLHIPDLSAPLSPEECNMLWPLVEKWEKTGHDSDLKILESVMERIWRDHYTKEIAGAEEISLKELMSKLGESRSNAPYLPFAGT